MRNDRYVLITPARNEEAYIETTIKAVVSQNTRPAEWVIVDDGSTDRTEEIVRRYLPKHDFIQLVRRSADGERSFASQAQAFRFGYQHLREKCYGYIGSLDGDISFDPDYYDRILAKFRADAQLGVAGGFIYEEHDGKFASRPFNTTRSVAGAIQLFRRQCLEEIGGYLPLKYGGQDTCADVMARMTGWRVEAFPDAKAYHHRHTASAGGRVLRSRFAQGRRDFSLGNHPVFEVFKCLRRLPEPPYLVGTLCRMGGFMWAAIRAEKRTVPSEFVRFMRNEQTDRVRRLFVNKLSR